MGLIAFFLNWLFGLFPAFYEAFYFKGVFQILRTIYDYTLGWMPIPMVYILFLGLVQLIYIFLKFKGFRKAKTWQTKIKSIVLPLLSFVGAVIFFFYFLWGFNYQQQYIADKLDFPEVGADTLELYNESLYFMNKLADLRTSISKDTLPLGFDHLPDNMEKEIRKSLESVLSSWDIPTIGKVRVRKLYPKGILLRISTAGVYIPFVFEGHIDAGLHPIQYPFIMAHEMSHGYGLADEGTCNFTGVLACMESSNNMMQYSAVMSLWRYMVGNLRRSAPSLYSKLVKQMDQNVRTDLIAILDEMDKYPDIMPKVRDAVYNSYLKSHGVKGGIASYSGVVQLMMQWKKSNKNPELKNRVYQNL